MKKEQKNSSSENTISSAATPVLSLYEIDHDSDMIPSNWSRSKKLWHTLGFGLTTFAAQMNSTAMAADKFSSDLNHEWGISREVCLLANTFYILGIAFGPMVFAPISEVYGRKIGVLVPFLISGLFSFATATSYNVYSMMVFRFFSGFFAGAPIVSAGGVLADLYPNNITRGKYFALYGQLVNGGSSLGPVVASLLMNSRNNDFGSWRIAQYFVGLLTFAIFAFAQVFLQETYTPVLNQREARKARIETGDWSIHCQLDSWRLDLRDVATKHLVRPFHMLATPVVFLTVLYASYVYGVFYIVITTIPEVFTITRGWTGTVAILPNLALFIGVGLGNLANVYWAIYRSKPSDATAPAESRFPPVMCASWLMPAGIFIFAWTSNSSIHWIVPCIGIAVLGTGFIVIFQGCLNYIVDTYTKYAASGIAANTFARSVFAASFPLFAKQLFVNLGVPWGGSLIGFIALGMIPIPFVFYRYGARIREKHPYVGV